MAVWTEAQFTATALGCGLTPPPANDPWGSVYQLIAARNCPLKADTASFITECIHSLEWRGFIYSKSKPGDCGSPTILDDSDLAALKLGQVGGSGVVTALSAIGTIGSTVAGVATLGIGIGVGVVTDILQHHASAVQTEQGTLCEATLVFNQSLGYIDHQVRTGVITPEQGISSVKALVTQILAYLNSIEQTCNAACYYQGFARAHADFVNQYYPAIAPAGQTVASQPPNSAPLTAGPLGGNPPGGAPATAGTSAQIHTNANVGATLTANIRQQQGPTAVNPLTHPTDTTVPALSSSSHTLVLAIIGVLIVVVLLK